jgi:hypothetical protein
MEEIGGTVKVRPHILYPEGHHDCETYSCSQSRPMFFQRINGSPSFGIWKHNSPCGPDALLRVRQRSGCDGIRKPILCNMVLALTYSAKPSPIRRQLRLLHGMQQTTSSLRLFQGQVQHMTDAGRYNDPTFVSKSRKIAHNINQTRFTPDSPILVA